jgi:uncharacterized protein with von Willebrand factor type A (vWA) domain
MRTDVLEAYDGAPARSTALDLVVRLVGRLRAAGLPVSTGETLDAVRALLTVDIRSREVVRSALRCTLVRTGRHDALFDRIFDELLPRASRTAAVPPTPSGRPGAPAPPARPPANPDEFRRALAAALTAADADQVHELADAAVEQWAGIDDGGFSARHHTQRLLRTLDLDRVLRALLDAAGERGTFERQLARARSVDDIGRLRELLERLAEQRLRRHRPDRPSPRATEVDDLPILTASQEELSALRAAVRPLARRLATRLGRRNRRGTGQLDMRRTIRRSISTGGVALDPVTRRRARTRPDLAVLCDVSGSVALFAPFALSLLHALHDEFPRVRSWVFVDGIVEVTGLMGGSRGMLNPNHLLARRGLVTGDGRSDYRRAMTTFLDDWPDAVSPRTTLLVVGDARSHERPPAMAELAELGRLSRRLYWLNPEPTRDWDTEDSRMGDYARRCTAVFEVATLRQLEEAVARIAG